jgi:hypothetical protein
MEESSLGGRPWAARQMGVCKLVGNSQYQKPTLVSSQHFYRLFVENDKLILKYI